MGLIKSSDQNMILQPGLDFVNESLRIGSVGHGKDKSGFSWSVHSYNYNNVTRPDGLQEMKSTSTIDLRIITTGVSLPSSLMQTQLSPSCQQRHCLLLQRDCKVC